MLRNQNFGYYRVIRKKKCCLPMDRPSYGQTETHSYGVALQLQVTKKEEEEKTILRLDLSKMMKQETSDAGSPYRCRRVGRSIQPPASPQPIPNSPTTH